MLNRIGIVCALAALSCAAAEVDFRAPLIVPAPKSLSYRADVPVRLDKETVFEVSAPEGDDWVKAKAKQWFGFEPEVRFTRVEGLSGTEARGRANGAYALVAEPGRISISARSATGVKYAMYTLRQAAERESAGAKLRNYWLPALTVKDEPGLAFRGVHLCWMPELSPTFIEHQIRFAAYYKFNYAVIESWGVFKGDRHPEFAVPGAKLTVREAKRLTALAADLGITLIPQVNVLGHGAYQRGTSGKHSSLDYRPEMQPLFEPAGGWNWCLSNPEARAYLRDYLAEVHDAFGRPPFFHIGCDEAAPPTCPTCRAAKPYAKLIERHLLEVAAMFRERGTRVMMWHDMLLEKGGKWDPFYANGSADEAKILEALPKDVVICDWYYGSDGGGKDPTGGTVKTDAYPTLDYFTAKGFDALTCPWRVEAGILAQGAYARRKGTFGLLETVWHHFRGHEFRDMMENAAHASWGDGRRPVEPWVQPAPGVTHWRQIGWDMGVDRYEDTGFYENQVTRDILTD